jgi:hypothetical protein
MIILHEILLRMRNVSDKSCRENHNIYCTVNNFFPKIVSFYEIMCKNMVETDSSYDDIKWHISLTWWITKATITHSEHIILIVFPWQPWLHKFSSMLHLCVYCLSCYETSYKTTSNHSTQWQILTYLSSLYTPLNIVLNVWTENIQVKGIDFIFKLVTYQLRLRHQYLF